MHLKSVEIQGFKTFAKKTELIFEPGITAIVGPNGSGKSNLVDAIRWVLGERSARELRGAKMEEVIYSGGLRRQASGIAEVRLVLDNSDGRLPLPYTEIEVLRRGFRSGESEYRLNGARCRLRDIEELFASTGLTQDGYAVVAQDDVDHIIQTTASERRALIEEAAGVRGLHSKRQEALGKMREADISIVRLKDLAGELGPRVEELRAQAEAARNHADAVARLDALRGSLARGEWLAAKHRAKKAQGRVDTLAAAVAAARSASEAARLAYSQQREKVAAAHDARLTRERELGTLRLAATQAESRVELLSERLESTRRAAADAVAAVTEAERRAASLDEELRGAQADAAALAQPAAVEESETPTPAAALLAERTSARQRLEAEAAELERRLAAVIDERDAAIQRREILEAGAADLARELADAEAAGSGLPADSASAAQADAERLSSELAAAAGAERMARQAESAAVQAFQAAEALVVRLTERADALESLVSAEEAPVPGAQRLAGLIGVPAGLAMATEAALGRETLDSWVLPRGADPELADRLGQGWEGSALLGEAGDPVVPSAPPVPGARPLAAEVGGPEWLQPLLSHLLHETWLVPDLAAARTVCRERPGATAVTAQGLALSGPRLRARRQGGSIDREARLRDVRAQLGEAKRSATAAAGDLDAARVAASMAASRTESARAGHVEAMALAAEHMGRAAAAAERQAEAAGRAERLRGALEARRHEVAGLQAQSSAADETSRLLKEELAASQAATAEARQAEEEARSPADAERAEVDARRAEARALANRAEAVRARLERAEAAVARQRTEVEALQGRGRELAEMLATLEADQAAAVAAATAARDALAAPAAQSTEDLDGLTAQLLELEKANLERQVALAHQEEALTGASEQLAAELAVLTELAARVGEAGEGSPEDLEIDWEKTQREIARLERQMAQAGPVNELAIAEYERDSARLGAIAGQLEDLVEARAALERIADELGSDIDRRFEAVFGAVAFNFQETFASLFVGGKATLKLDDPEAEEPGVEILAQPAGKKMRGIRLLSGGERALTALAFILALEKVNPSPFYIFDEVDAPLDDANVKRFNVLLQSLAAENQFLMITHNHQTMTSAQALYGVTLEDSGVSRVVSVRLREGQVVPVSSASRTA